MATAPQLVASLASMNRDVSAWVDGVAKLTMPEHTLWCDGTPAEFQRLEREVIGAKELLPLNPQSFPGCVLARSAPKERAPGGQLKYGGPRKQEDPRPKMPRSSSAQDHPKMDALFAGCMKG